jgi:hypothetical protein
MGERFRLLNQEAKNDGGEAAKDSNQSGAGDLNPSLLSMQVHPAFGPVGRCLHSCYKSYLDGKRTSS